MFSLSPDFVAAQDAGKTFATDYYNRLNALSSQSIRPVSELFAECSRYYAFDSLNSRPAVGREDAVRAVRQFCAYYGGQGQRVVWIVSVDVQNDTRDRGLDDEYDYDYDGDEDDDGYEDDDDDDGYEDDDDDCEYDDDGNSHGGYSDATEDGPMVRRRCRHVRPSESYTVFVRAEWTDPNQPSAAMPFVQMFHVRRLRDDDGHRFKICSTYVKTMAAATAVQPLLEQHKLLSFDHRPKAAGPTMQHDYRNNHYEAPSFQYNDENLSGNKKQLNADATEFELRPPPSEQPHWSDDDEWEAEYVAEMTDKQSAEEKRNEYTAYREKVRRFIAKDHRGKKPKDERRRVCRDRHRCRCPYRPAAAFTDQLCVDHLNHWISADDLYVAMGYYGPVRSVRVEMAATSVLGYGPGCHVDSIARVRFENTDSVDRAMADHMEFGCTIRGVRLSFRRSTEPDPGDYDSPY